MLWHGQCTVDVSINRNRLKLYIFRGYLFNISVKFAQAMNLWSTWLDLNDCSHLYRMSEKVYEVNHSLLKILNVNQ